MRWILTSILCLALQLAFGQNYQPINSNSLQVFYQTSVFPIGGWGIPEEGGNMWGTRIDSAKVNSQGDSIFYNYPIYRDTALENGNYDCNWWDAPNWNGTHVRVDSSGSSWFYNQDGDSLRIHHSAGLNEKWKAFQYQNGDSIIAEVTDIQFMDDGWIMDSVKTIVLTQYTIGNPSPFGPSLELYKDAGFRKTLDFVKFPTDTVQIYRVDRNSINENSPGYSLNGVIRPEPNVGDGFYHVNRTSEYPGLYTYSLLSELITSVQPYGLDGQLQVGMIQNTTSGSQSLGYIYDALPDTFITLIKDNDGGNLMPREGWMDSNFVIGADYYYHIGSTIYDNNGCQYPIVSFYDFGNYYTTSNLDPCVHYGSHECMGGDDHFAPYIGFIAGSSFVDDGWCVGNGTLYEWYYTYLKIGDHQCGEYAMVSIDEINQQLEFDLYPNPANQTVSIRLPHQPIPNTVRLDVKDMLGRAVLSTNPSTTTFELDISAWPNGVYVITISSDNGSAHTKKLVVQH